jgi:septum formation protein
MSTVPDLILASSSPRRSMLLESIGLHFTIQAGHAEELHDETMAPARLCEINAQRKALEIALQHRGALVLGADTLVARDRKIYGKPRNLDDARRILSELSDGVHQVITGVALLRQATNEEVVFSETTQVEFLPLTHEQIELYLSRANVLDKAGAYAIQEFGGMLVKSIDGSMSNVVGLPLEQLRSRLFNFGIKTLAPGKTASSRD